MRQSWADITEEQQHYEQVYAIIIVAHHGRIVQTAVLNGLSTWRQVLEYGRPPPVINLDAELFTTASMVNLTNGADVCTIQVTA